MVVLSPGVPLIISVGTWDLEANAVIDTGFEGAVTVPHWLGPDILAEPEIIPFALADGTLRDALVWEGRVEIEGRAFRPEVAALGTQFLLGREILDQLHVCFDFGRSLRVRFADGGEVVFPYQSPGD
jgi:predicted aspartyl protease